MKKTAFKSGVIGCLIFIIHAVAVSRELSAVEPVKACGQATKARPGTGQSYSGIVENDDYDFTARVPYGLTGWSGVDRSAPFHGFTIFLPEQQGCIVFEVHLRVDESDAPVRPTGSKALRLGRALGWETVATNNNGLASVTIARASFSFRQSDQNDDGIVVLIVPISQKRPAIKIYDSFVHSMQFGRASVSR
jgi:hypothetical protein